MKPKKPPGGGGGGGGGPKGNPPPAAANKNPGDPAAAIQDDGEDQAPGLKERIENELADRNRGLEEQVDIIDDTNLNPGDDVLPALGEDDGNFVPHNSDANDLFSDGAVDPNDPDVFDPSLGVEPQDAEDQVFLGDTPTHGS